METNDWFFFLGFYLSIDFFYPTTKCMIWILILFFCQKLLPFSHILFSFSSFISFCQLLTLEALNHSHLWMLLLVCSSNICIFNYLLLCIIFGIGFFFFVVFLCFFLLCVCVCVLKQFCLQDYNEYIVCCDYKIFGRFLFQNTCHIWCYNEFFICCDYKIFNVFFFLFFYEYKMMMMIFF
jgi:hypothetical protein